MADAKPDCTKCKHIRTVPGDCHVQCDNHKAHVVGDPHGVRHGWFYWPLLFDPVWLVSCNGFEEKS